MDEDRAALVAVGVRVERFAGAGWGAAAEGNGNWAIGVVDGCVWRHWVGWEEGEVDWVGVEGWWRWETRHRG